jgi:signal recognition particle receptor subunit alpha
MLDHFSIFTKGGVLLWTLHHAAAAASAAGATAAAADAAAVPRAQLDAINSLVRSVLLEERSGEQSYTHTPRQGAAQTLKWTFHNGLDLVFVAGYQKALPLAYVDPLLAAARDEFCSSFFDAQSPGSTDYRAFGRRFEALQREAEAQADAARKAAGSAGAGKAAGAAAVVVAAAGKQQQQQAEEDDHEDEEEPPSATPEQQKQHQHHAFDLSRLKGKLKGGGSAGKEAASGGKESGGGSKSARRWGPGGGRTDAEEKLDYSVGAPPAASLSPSTITGRSRMDDDNALVSGGDDSAFDREAAAAALEARAAAEKGASSSSSSSRGVLGSFAHALALRVAGSSALTHEDLEPALQEMRRKLMERNVAEGIAAQVVDSVARSLVGKKLSGFTGVGTLVKDAFEDAVSGVLNKRSADVLLDARRARERGRPYVVVFCGVNGVGKSTNLAKIAYWLGQNGLKVQLAACDTFRAGAVEQLKTHAARLGVPLYERGYERDPAKVAFEAVKQAQREGRDVVLVDTAGRMQDNEPLMRALANLIAVNAPDLVLFVGEALVGNDAVDQLVKFSRALADLAPAATLSAAGGGGGDSTTANSGGRPPRAPGIDGIVLTKFDTIDDKVGAALSMTYTSGAPILFVGCGQTYQDLTRLNAKAVVRALLR